MTRPAGRRRAWAELLRVSALFTVPGDALVGAAATGLVANRRTALAIGSSLCLYEAGMALNDWADRHEDAIDRPHRPIPSGRVTPAAALAASAALTATGLALAARAGRAPLAVAGALAATVWAYDLRLKHTAAAPAAMATARALDLLLGATATATVPIAPLPPAPATRPGRTTPTAHGALPALPSAVLLGAHTYAVTAVSRHEAHGGSTTAPLAALATTTLLAALAAHPRPAREAPPTDRAGATRRAGATGRSGATWRARVAGGARPVDRAGAAARAGAADRAGAAGRSGATRRARVAGGAGPVDRAGAAARAGAADRAGTVRRPGTAGHTRATDRAGATRRAGTVGWGLAAGGPDAGSVAAGLAAATYLRTAAVPLLHAALNPSPPLTQRAVGGGIRAMIPLQAALAARGGALGTGLALMGLVPLARTLARKVSPT